MFANVPVRVAVMIPFEPLPILEGELHVALLQRGVVVFDIDFEVLFCQFTTIRSAA
jgi:hypothetical protein